MVVSIFYGIFAADFKQYRTMTVFLLIVGLVVLAIVATVKMNGEEKLIEKAETNWFYHAIAKMTVSNYKGYYPNEEEVKSAKSFVKQESEYDSHPVGAYLKMRKELKGMLSMAGNFHNYKLDFNLGEVGTGLAVMAVFVIVVILGVTL